MTKSKLELLTALRDTLLDLIQESKQDADDWSAITYMLARATDMLTDERRRQGWMGVYPIVNGCARDALFEGTREQCKLIVDNARVSDPAVDLIVLPL